MNNPIHERKTEAESYVSLHLPCRYGFLRIIRQAVLDLCARAGMTEMQAATLEMAVDEACSNVMEHSYGGERNVREDDKHPGLRINLIQEAQRVIVEIFDQGKGFSFDAQTTVDPAHYLELEHQRGLGMFIIRKFVDDIAYLPGTPQGHCLRLIKRL